MRPSSVRSPVRTTTAVPVPDVTIVPPWAIDTRSATTASAATGAGCLAAGTDSPVSGASSTSSPREPSSRASAGDALAGAQLDDVAGHDALGVELRAHAVADHRRPLRDERRERLDRTAGAPLLDEPDRAVGDHDGEHDGAVGDLAERERDGTGGDQHENQRARELPPQQHRRRLGAHRRDAVGAEALEPRARLRGRQPVTPALDRRQRVIAVERVPVRVSHGGHAAKIRSQGRRSIRSDRRPRYVVSTMRPAGGGSEAAPSRRWSSSRAVRAVAVRSGRGASSRCPRVRRCGSATRTGRGC